jgi:hypothetical protein
MNSKQAAVIETVTSKQWLEWKFCQGIAGELTFEFKHIGDKVFVHGSNAGAHKWFERFTCVQMIIGKRGGVSKLKIQNFGLGA